MSEETPNAETSGERFTPPPAVPVPAGQPPRSNGDVLNRIGQYIIPAMVAAGFGYGVPTVGNYVTEQDLELAIARHSSVPYHPGAAHLARSEADRAKQEAVEICKMDTRERLDTEIGRVHDKLELMDEKLDAALNSRDRRR